MYFIMVDVYPSVDNDMLGVCDARVNAWINVDSESMAKDIVLKTLIDHKWNIGAIINCYDVTLDSYVNSPDGKELYEQALIDGEVYSFHSADRIALYADGDFTRYFQPDDSFFCNVNILNTVENVWGLFDEKGLHMPVIDEQALYPLFLTKERADIWATNLFNEFSIKIINGKNSKTSLFEALEKESANIAYEDTTNNCLISCSNYYLLEKQQC